MRRLALAFLLLLPFAVQAQMLTIEWRWVDSTISGAAVGGVRDGATVWGTAGSVSPKGGTTYSTRQPEDAVSAVERLSVLNGHEASVRLTRQQPLQLLDYRVDPQSRKARAVTQTTQMVERSSGFSVKPEWKGGNAPVQLTIKVLTLKSDGQADGQGELSTTSVQPMGSWHAVARSGGTAKALPKGTYGTAEAEGIASRELQIRVSVEP